MGQLPWGQLSGGNCPGGICPRTSSLVPPLNIQHDITVTAKKITKFSVVSYCSTLLWKAVVDAVYSKFDETLVFQDIVLHFMEVDPGNCPLGNFPGQFRLRTIVFRPDNYAWTTTAQSNDNYKLNFFHGYFLFLFHGSIM